MTTDHTQKEHEDSDLRTTRNLHVQRRDLNALMRIMNTAHLNESSIEREMGTDRFEATLPDHNGSVKAILDRSDFVLMHRYLRGERWHVLARVPASGDVAVSVRYSRNRELADVVRGVFKTPLWYFTANQGRQSRCIFCGRNLDVEISLRLGYGPVCARQLELPWQ